MKIMGVDIGGGTGIALDGERPWAPLFIPVRLPSARNGDYGPGGWKFFCTLSALIEENTPELIAYETPMATGGRPGQSNEHAHRQQLGRAYLLETVAARYGLPCESAAVTTIRKHFVGQGFPKDAKRAVNLRCHQLGWRPPDHNCADAAAVWDYFKSIYAPGWGARVTPLMMHDEALP